MAYRLYSFVAGGYLNGLQKGLQTGHAIGNMSIAWPETALQRFSYDSWAEFDKTIIILEAFNQRGVLEAEAFFKPFLERQQWPYALFREDEDSMNGMATCFAMVVSEDLALAKRDEPEGSYTNEANEEIWISRTHPMYDFIERLQSYEKTSIT